MRRAAIVCVTALLASACTSGTQVSDAATSALTTTTTPSTSVPTSSMVSISALPPSIALSVDAWPGPCGHPGPRPSSYDHVIWIWMENKNVSAVSNTSDAPFLHGLMETCGAASRYVDHGIHPSLPNYLAATSGGTQGVSDDDAPASHRLDVDNIFRQVRALGKAARSYEEAMPSNCSLQSTDRYAVKHNPAAYYVGDDDRAACERDNVSFDQFSPDLASGLPAFSLITPDICNDMHDCSVAAGDTWLHDVVSAVTSSATYREGRTALFIVFDESQGGGSMPFVAIAPTISPGTLVATELDHYALLAFTEDVLGIVDRLGGATGAASVADAFGM